MEILSFIGAVMVTMWAISFLLPIVIVIAIAIIEKVSK
jgi:hypothetical protein